MGVPILAYHKISDRFEWGVTNVPIRSFENQIRFLSRNQYYSISLDQYLSGNFEHVRSKIPIIITFDDADESVYSQALPILHHYGFVATVFVISDFVGKENTWDYNFGNRFSQHLTWDQISELSTLGWEIGSHTITHQDLTHLSDEQVTQELLLSKEIISENINLTVKLLSYPFNRFDARIVALTEKAGYSAACALYANQKQQNSFGNFCLTRSGVYAFDTMKMFRSKLINSRVERLKQRIISQASRGTIWYKRWKN